MYTHTNKVDKANILQRDGLMLNRNIKKNRQNDLFLQTNYLQFEFNRPLRVKFTQGWLC